MFELFQDTLLSLFKFPWQYTCTLAYIFKDVKRGNLKFYNHFHDCKRQPYKYSLKNNVFPNDWFKDVFFATVAELLRNEIYFFNQFQNIVYENQRFFDVFKGYRQGMNYR